MTLTLADTVILMSLVKPLIGTAVLIGWARWATVCDKDSLYFNLNRRLWNAVQMAAAALGFAAILLIPYFIAGLFLALLVMVGGAAGYIYVRNQAVPEGRRWRFDIDMVKAMLLRQRQKRAEKQALLKFTAAAGSKAGLKQVPLPEDPVYDAHIQMEEFLEAAFRRNASRVDLTGNDSQFVAQITVDGVDYKHSQLPATAALAVIDYLKAQCGLDVSDRRRKQTGKCTIEMEGQGTHDLRIDTAGSTRGLTLTILVDPTKQLAIPLAKLGLLDSQMERLKPALETGKGVVLVATPPKNGRTVTLYSLTQSHDPYTMDIHTVEAEVERELDGVTQKIVAAADMPKMVQSTMLKDPHVVMIAQINDQQTARLVASAGVEGRRVYAGLKADDTFSGLKLWLKAVGDANIVADGLTAVLSERLIRKLCTYCRQKYKPDAAALRKLNLPADKIPFLYKQGGKVMVKNKPEPCPACSATGYSGRVAAFEVMVLDDEARQLVRTANFDGLRTHLRRQRTLWLEEAALARVVDGTTSIGEVMRALGQAAPAAAAQAAEPSQSADQALRDLAGE